MIITITIDLSFSHGKGGHAMIRVRHVGCTKISWQTEKCCHSERAKRVEESRRGRCCPASRTARPLDFARGDSKKGIDRNGWRTPPRAVLRAWSCLFVRRKGAILLFRCAAVRGMVSTIYRRAGGLTRR